MMCFALIKHGQMILKVIKVFFFFFLHFLFFKNSVILFFASIKNDVYSNHEAKGYFALPCRDLGKQAQSSVYECPLALI